MSISFDQIKVEFPSACACGEVTCFYCFEDTFNAQKYNGETCNTVDETNCVQREFGNLEVSKEIESTTNMRYENLTDIKKEVDYESLHSDVGVDKTVEKYGMIKHEHKSVISRCSSERKIKLYHENYQDSKLKHTNWIPPRSPYNLIQETLFHKPWQLLVATIFLNKTSAKVAVPLFWKFVNKWCTPESLQSATIIEIAALMQPLGLNVRRAIQLKRFTYEFLHKNWCYPRELTGIGQYGDDSYRIFCVNEWKDVKPKDSKLKKYIAWLMANKDILDIT
ncbi:hypothetical protein R5R35_011677 [Gryllus longicercus]|uniref:Uncharacterized protein n=1 Tax=Gryllus longicercus TaxID=2509291 RepID=A0AAN9VA35_9ORTH